MSPLRETACGFAPGRVALRRCAVWWVAAFLVMAVAPASAQNALFTVEDIAIDATAGDANAAREIALAAGMREALDVLLRRITPRQHHGRLPTPGAAALQSLVFGFEIDNERTSDTRYLASLTVSFSRDAIRQELQRAEVPFTETAARPALVLPVYNAAGAQLLWDEPNPWRDAWGAVRQRDTLTPLLLPNGDLTDVSLIGAAQASRGDDARLNAIATRYAVQDVLVAEANLRFEIGSRTPSIDVVLRSSGPDGEHTTVEGYRGGNGEMLNALLARAVADIALGIEERWKRDTLLEFGTEGQLAATVPLAALEEWVDVRRRLEAAPEVKTVELTGLTRAEASIRVSYFGDPGRLRLALGQRGLALAEQDGYWTLTRRTAP
ncbi:MAG: DUF2066 domain-containing protein [Proteobacteria bacterium]|nr:DUF2066 domain-containing protein [Pseudomonadota bacterium]MDA1132822.1 DUF2066 domain-containing protein [Pseudomonadota bacterium]